MNCLICRKINKCVKEAKKKPYLYGLPEEARKWDLKTIKRVFKEVLYFNINKSKGSAK